MIDGKLIETDVAPQLVNNRTLVPLRVISEALGADVNWDQQSRTVEITADRSSSGTVEGGKLIPNRYDEEFILADDELFIFVENYKPFETEGIHERIISDALKAQFPEYNIRFEIWDMPIRSTDLAEAGIMPDIYVSTPRTHYGRTLKAHGWEYDMTDLIAESSIDLDKLNQGAVEMIKSRSDGGMYGVPWFINEFVMYYNKKHLDAFEQQYPTNGMTYDEIYEWLPNILGQAGVLTVKGITQHPDQYLDFNQLGLYPFVPGDKEHMTKQEIRESVKITTDEWLHLVENLYRFLTVPGNNFNSTSDFFQRGNYSLAIDTIEKLPKVMLEKDYFGSEDEFKQHEEWASRLEIGIASVPVFSEENNWTYQPNLLSLSITNQSEKKEQAMEVIEWLVSEEGQLQISRNGLKAVLETDEIVEQFGANLPNYAKIEGLAEAVYWGENAHVQNYENTEWPHSYDSFPLWYVFRMHVLQNGSAPELALQNAEKDIYNWYWWDE